MNSSAAWPALRYEEWRGTCDTVHAHTQVLGKLAAALAPPEPELQHAALRLGVRGWETRPFAAPDGSGVFAVVLDLCSHEAIVRHSDGRDARVPLAPDRSVGTVTREVLAAVRSLVGPVEIDPTPQETPWQTPLDEDEQHATYEPIQVARYFTAATRAVLVLAAVRAPYRGRSTPVNAWWGSLDLTVSLYSGAAADPPATDFITRNAIRGGSRSIGWCSSTTSTRSTRRRPTLSQVPPSSRSCASPEAPPLSQRALRRAGYKIAPGVLKLQALRKTGATGLEPATSGVTVLSEVGHGQSGVVLTEKRCRLRGVARSEQVASGRRDLTRI